MVSQKKLKILADALSRAALLSEQHTEAVRDAEEAFLSTFGTEVPEEMGIGSGAFATSKEEVGAMFNNFTNYGENISSGNTANDIVLDMVNLMKKRK